MFCTNDQDKTLRLFLVWNRYHFEFGSLYLDVILFVFKKLITFYQFLFFPSLFGYFVFNFNNRSCNEFSILYPHSDVYLYVSTTEK